MVDQSTTWVPILEECSKKLKRWGAARHSLDGRRLILQMQIVGVTQYPTMVQGMPTAVESEINKHIRNFTWNHKKANTVNQVQMYAPHKCRGKKILDIEARNKAIHLMWLKTYLHLGEDRATWMYFADAIIGTDVPPSHRIDNDLETRVMPFLQTWDTRIRNSMLPEDLKTMMKLAREYNVRVSATNPTKLVRGEMPLWYHTCSEPSARKLYNTRVAKCLRKTHRIRLVKDATAMLRGLGEDHTPAVNCTCATCGDMQVRAKCKHPAKCLTMLVTLLNKITPTWNLDTWTHATSVEGPGRREGGDEPLDRKIEREDETDSLTGAIRIFGEMEGTDTSPEPPTWSPQRRTEITTVYTDGACLSNGGEEA